MALKLVWSQRAEKGYDRIINYLEKNWTDREISEFIKETNHFFELLKENPHLLEPTRNRRNLYRGPINR
ncbi:MAG: type II toxin-antitoxin system RelE/ParE family toxin [Bacteroidales bacterium]|nr:type II toxin-antitoxin system RelE/ParE family toxin [Bacteroidales bacterium]